MTTPRFDEFMHLDPSAFDVVFEKVTVLPFQDRDAWARCMQIRTEQIGAGHIWRGSMYWSAELGQCGSVTLYVSESDVYIERIYVDEFLRKNKNGMRGFSYYLLREIKKGWPNHKITFHDDIYSRDLWNAVAKHGVIKKVEVSEDDEGGSYYEVVGDHT